MLKSTELVWLLAATAKGDEAAFERLYEATRAKLYGIVVRILRRSDLASDVMQDAYLKIWAGAAQFDPAGPPLTWMVAIARRQAIDALRRAAAPAGDEPEPAPAGASAPPARRAMSEELKRLLAGMGRLDEDRRRLLLHAYFSGCTRRQLAEKLGAPVAAVETELRTALAELRECLT